MLTRTFAPRQFLRLVYGTEPFLDYCRRRTLAFEQLPDWLMHDDDYPRWTAALAALPEAEQARVELELAQVNELAHPTAIARLIEGAVSRGLPPEAIPGDAALALWFLLHHPSLFHDVFLHQEIGEVEAWRTAKARPGIMFADLRRCQAALAKSLQQFLAIHEGTGRFCAVEAYPLSNCTYFVVYLSDRLRLFEGFTDEGRQTTQRWRPAIPMLFVYYPADGTLLLKARARSQDNLLDLFRRFARAVLGIDLDERALAPAFRLDRFKQRFEMLPDGEDIEMVRVKALHLAYPERAGRRRLKLETLAGDGRFAILDLLSQHGGGDHVLEQLAVLYAEVQVKLWVAGRSKSCVIRLWPDRCNLNQTALGERLRGCLKRWGILYAT